jgi:hypothetical protein
MMQEPARDDANQAGCKLALSCGPALPQLVRLATAGDPPEPRSADRRPMQQRLRRYRAPAIRARVVKPPDERERAVEIVFVGARSPTSSTQNVGMA